MNKNVLGEETESFATEESKKIIFTKTHNKFSEKEYILPKPKSLRQQRYNMLRFFV